MPQKTYVIRWTMRKSGRVLYWGGLGVFTDSIDTARIIPTARQANALVEKFKYLGQIERVAK